MHIGEKLREQLAWYLLIAKQQFAACEVTFSIRNVLTGHRNLLDIMGSNCPFVKMEDIFC